ncbi:TetR/AcrR family transcriptional regulator [Zafaria cholistanensis]|uniref:TetR/AcrR family transcriptional regulator n=1 Tax=Zafaria cholistanensis TaxID=1682741 RepID=UPI0012309248|nr:TetR/AcrR family transcriptional regulator [Zafaria cholistanensis]
MNPQDPRPHGRAVRVQQAVHAAVRSLQAEHGRQSLTVPKIAALAGVAPSTIYRRWGDLNQLLADVAVARMRPQGPPDTGTVRGDLTAWAEEYLEESASPTGREFLRDMVAGGADCSSALRGGEYARARIGIMLERARHRGEDVPDLEDVIDLVLAPIVYRILFEPGKLPPDAARRLTDRLFERDA